MINDIKKRYGKDNAELKEILTYVTKEPIFFGEECRLLSEDEMLNYKDELNTGLEIIPLVDLYDNDFLVYNIKENKFQLLDISSDEFWKDVVSINQYIEQLREFFKKK